MFKNIFIVKLIDNLWYEHGGQVFLQILKKKKKNFLNKQFSTVFVYHSSVEFTCKHLYSAKTHSHQNKLVNILCTEHIYDTPFTFKIIHLPLKEYF